MTFPSLSSSSTLDFAAVAPQQAPSYAAVGGGAAPFFDLFFDPSTSGNFFASPCARHAARRAAGAGNGDKRRRSRDSAPTTPRRRNIDAGVGPPAFAARYAGTNRLGKLYCRTGFHLQIHADGRVNGTRRDNSRFGVLEFLSVAIGLVSIKGKESNRYLCMNQKGKLYGSANHSTDCIFMERMLENYYNTYTSCKYSRKNRKWFVALNKRGRPRKGGRSKKKQKFSQFLVLHLDDDDDVGGQQQQQKRRNFFKSIVDNSNGNNIRRSGQQQAPAGRQLGIGSFTDKWQQSRKAADANVVMRVWTRRRDEKHLHIANNLDENRRRRRTDNTNIDKIYQKNIHNKNNNNNSGNNGNHNERRTGWRRAAFVDENG